MSHRGTKARGGGYWRNIEPLPDWQTTTVQVCGLWPFSKGKGVPIHGVPLGKEQESGVAVAGDPITYFTTGLIPQPSCWIQGDPGLGKSSFACRQIIGMENFGVSTFVLGDIKGEYVSTITALGGQVIKMGRGQGHINILDHEYAVRAANMTDADGEYLLPSDLRAQLLGDATARRKTGVEALINILRRQPPTEADSALIEVALEVLFREWTGELCPVLSDLLAVIEPQEMPGEEGELWVHPEVREVVMDGGSMKKYLKATRKLRGSLRTLSRGTGVGAMFCQQTDVEMMMDRSVVFDVSSVKDDSTAVQAAALIVCWNLGFGRIETQQVLADAGVIERRNYNVVVDELWRPLQAGHGMVDQFSASTRLNRSQGISIIFCTHSLADPAAQANEDDRLKAMGIPRRCGMHVYFGTSRAELKLIDQITPLSAREKFDLASWSTPGSWNQVLGTRADAPGLGLCLIKVQGRGGLRVVIKLTQEELNLHNTDERWAQKARAVSA